MENERTYNIVVFRTALFRLLCSFRYWAEVIAAALICFSSPYIMEMVSRLAESFSPEVFESFRQGSVYNIGLLSVPSLDINSYLYCDRIISGVLSGSVTQCMLVIISTTFIASEFAGGYFLKALILGHSRTLLFAKYTAVVSVGSLLPIILCPVCLGLSLRLKYNMSVSDIGLLTKTLIVQVFMALALIVCVASVSVAITGKGATAVGLGCILALPLLPNYLQAFTSGKINIEKYMLVSRLINSCEMSPVAEDIITAIITMAVFFGLGSLINSARNFN